MAFFDSEAKTYDSWYDTKLGEFVDEIERKCAFNLFLPFEGKRILDIGCGTGNYSIRLAKLGYEVVGIDISDEMLDIAKEKAKGKKLDIEFYNMDIYDLKFDDNEFDGAFSMAAFEFVEDTEKALDEIFRVIKSEGQVLIGTINKDSNWGELYLSEDFQKNSVFKYAHFKTMGDFTRIYQNKIVNKRECLFIPPSINVEDISIEKEKALSHNERGGFICVLWKK
ncbi:methyltransferase domain-containing protein [Clostridium sp. D2Q-14]|uniref:class I SAM-dependent methyltransferase n=1 Tax=Anaeromonas gelatinilytica TaxID=2683194 RepID=UPI00193B5D38|nr:class I SAM-dependent methyltransferase [Anaeromonas gelatinilytica]MBS4534315.1 methyltransferase domain-containing protein [Anaeromonas gelatinilytica]